MAASLVLALLAGALPASDDAIALVRPPSPPPAAEEAEADISLPWNEISLPWFTLRLGGGFLFDASAYLQNPESKRQIELTSPAGKVRDFRVILGGRLGSSPYVTYSLGYMFDGVTDTWRFRQTGITLEVPALWGRVFIGRSKEGISMNKIMVGYSGWTIERATANDAFIPILADGVKWMGNSPDGMFVWNLGYFLDAVSKVESFNRNDMQVTGRFAFVPLRPSPGHDVVLYTGVGLRYGAPDDGFLQFRSKPESSPAPYFIDTGQFRAEASFTTELEAYYQPGSLTIGAEYFLNPVVSRAADNPFFHGGELVVADLLTGEVRPYRTKGGFFEGVKPKRSVFSGGPGAVEVVGRVSFTDLDGGTIRGGQFLRITPMLNWHMSDNVRLEGAYGLGFLWKLHTTGMTQFFDLRLQLQL